MTDDKARSRTKDNLLDAFQRELISRGSDEKGRYVPEVRRQLGRVFDGCGWATLADVRREGFERYLASLVEAGRSITTRNLCLTHLRTLLNWCVERGWLAENPIAGIKPTRVGAADRRHPRRAYTREELQRLLSGTPEPRKTLYLVAALSGLRKMELYRLEKRDLSPAGDNPRWHLRASICKGKREDVVPMLPDLVGVILPVWLALPLPTSRLFGPEGFGTGHPIRSRILWADLASARIPRQDDRGRFADFHSFRYTFCRLMAESLPIKKVQVLMRHAHLKETADTYMQLGIEDVGEDVWRLPALGLIERSRGRKTDTTPGPPLPRNHKQRKA